MVSNQSAPQSQRLPAHVAGLLAYLGEPAEKANEDLALQYFRTLSGPSFQRQKEAHRADGYVPGSYVLELKGQTQNWLSGLFQGLAYRNQGLDFNQIVVAAKGFLAIWRVNDLDEDIRTEILNSTGAPSTIGASLAKKYKDKRGPLLKAATWRGEEFAGNLFTSNPTIVQERIAAFERALKNGRKVRLRVTPKNFASTLEEMKDFFDQPIKAVRAFFSMVYGWDEHSTVQLSQKASDQATLGGELITNLISSKRGKFKDFVEERAIYLTAAEHIDDFFARYDEALDAVDRDFRIKHGIFFTDRDLSKFVLWFVRSHVPELGKNYIVIDPACGSGNLVTNWRSPLELRHKVVSEIEPELLFGIEQRMKGDQWHNGKFTVVPKVVEGRGLNFLDCSAREYLDEIRRYLKEKGLKPDKPIAFLCNPPYRNDDDQTAEKIPYAVHNSITEITGVDASNERYCCFLAQMRLICEVAEESGLPGESLLLLFTKSSWLTNRPVFESIRRNMCGVFEDVDGILVNAREFFDVKGTWPLAFTLWRYKGSAANLDASRSISLRDLTSVKKSQLTSIPWDDINETNKACARIVAEQGSVIVALGERRTSIREWSGQKMLDFKRNRRMNEKNQKVVGGLPLGDPRQNNKKAYGETEGRFVGFMDDLTPCRVKKSTPDRPWFRLNSPLMDIKKTRCLSGPPDQKGYCASNLESAKKLFFWYALARTFVQHPYPMWADSDDMWEPTIPTGMERPVFQAAFAIAYAENECVAARFPSDNPVPGVSELNINNPMTPLNPFSFWSAVLRPYCKSAESAPAKLIETVDSLFRDWKTLFGSRTEVPLSRKPYLLDDNGLPVSAGIVQILDYANEAAEPTLLRDWKEIQQALRLAKSDYFNMITSAEGLNYFGAGKKKPASQSLVEDNRSTRA
jgi:hypothetical protein